MLGLSDPWHNSTFCIYDQDVITHVESERFTRHRYDFINPVLTFCEMLPERVQDFSNIAVEESPFAVCPFFKKLTKLKSQGIDTEKAIALLEMPYGEPSLSRRMGHFPFSNKTEAIDRFMLHALRKDVDIFFCGHHASHAANSFFSSGFSSAMAVTLDGGGYDFTLMDTTKNVIRAGDDIRSRRIYGGVFRCEGDDCVPVYQLTEFSFGFAWHRVTVNILSLPEGSEGTVMAMAGLGDPQHYRQLLDDRWIWLPGEAEKATGLVVLISRLRSLVNSDQDRYDLAAALQTLTETRVRQYLKQFIGSETSPSLRRRGNVFELSNYGQNTELVSQAARDLHPAGAV